ncbi:hypothetical protein PIROE2DRAFT_16637 [Piromyces sp. E2]|nr:hypothetical protein PIROE2DRAFT_16637 [Piromyces sp. E2]|eukprot:OUM58175.1 hypothetical protein PIROE2DRAFT_16637 [Piromyces sp. E2]
METESNFNQIRPLQETDLDEVMSIWLTSNLEAHSFISSNYWKSHVDEVREAIATAAQVYVYEDGTHGIMGFIGIVSDNFIAGLFVRGSHRSQGIGKALIQYCQREYSFLSLKVFTKNHRACLFYQREGFTLQEESLDPSTNEKEYYMVWKKEGEEEEEEERKEEEEETGKK